MGLLSTIGAASGRAFGFTRSAIAAATDAFFNRVTLLLPGNGTNGAQNNTFLDSSTNNFTITRNGNTTQGTFSPFSQTGWGNYFDGSSAYLSVANATALNLSSGDFTIECWCYWTGVNSIATLFNKDGVFSSTYPSYDLSLNGSGFLRAQVGTGNGTSSIQTITSNTSLPKSTYVHVAFVKSGTTLTLYQNGLSVASATQTATMTDGGKALLIGYHASQPSTNYFDGYISNVRITKGGALYTSNFTPSTTPLATTVSAGTVSLLTCQSNRFVDNSSNTFALTVVGTPSVQAFSPFAPTAAYSASTNGGSGYFDGTGDYLDVPSNAAFGYGAGDFTIEFWVYPTVISASTPNLLDQRINISNQLAPTIYLSNGQLRFYTNGLDRITGNTLSAGIWYHIALCRSGTSTKLYVNGVQVGSTYTDSNSYINSPVRVFASNDGATTAQAGYCSNLRIVKGQALATGNFTPPTSPVTTSAVGWTGANAASSLTGTVSLLLNFTNAGITDATGKNVLETVGNAQISTTQSKFGGSSMYFDGTGDYLVTSASQLYNIFPADFTIECYVYFNSVANTPHIWNIGTSTSNRVALYLSSSKVNLYSDTGAGGTNKIVGTTTIATGQWYYIALTKSGTTFTLYVDGTSQGTSTTTVYPNAANIVGLGFNNFGSASGDYLNGYIDDFRITRGYVRTVTSTPTSAFPVQ